jgi:DNA polymerase zeta
VKGLDFYGFHTSFTPFLKILVANPTFVTRIATILQSGSVMGTRFRVFESHLSYILQFMCDFGLYGCGEIEIEDALERCPELPDETPEISSSKDSNNTKFGPSSYFRESRLPLEVDVIAPHILNRHRLFARDLHHCLQISSPDLPREPLVLSVRELWDDERKHRQSLGLHPSPEIPIDPSESSRAEGGEWVAEARWWDEIRTRIEREREAHDPVADDKRNDWERFVMTAFESVEAIWEKEYKTWKPARKQESEHERIPPVAGYSWDPKNIPGVDAKDVQIEVDISMLSNQDLSQLDQEEERNWNRDALDDVAGEEEIEEPEDTYEESIRDEDLDLASQEADEQRPG